VVSFLLPTGRPAALLALVSLVAACAPAAGCGRRGLPSDHPVYESLFDELRLQVLPGVVAGVLSKPELRSDQIHPNAAGYALMAATAAEALSSCR
jgi:lysophospholipase L1-like esterase